MQSSRDFSPFMNGLDEFIHYRKFTPQLEHTAVFKNLTFVASLQCNTIIAGTYAGYSSTSDFLHYPPLFLRVWVANQVTVV